VLLPNPNGWEQAPLPRTGGAPARAAGSLATPRVVVNVIDGPQDDFDNALVIRKTFRPLF